MSASVPTETETKIRALFQVLGELREIDPDAAAILDGYMDEGIGGDLAAECDLVMKKVAAFNVWRDAGAVLFARDPELFELQLRMAEATVEALARRRDQTAERDALERKEAGR